MDSARSGRELSYQDTEAICTYENNHIQYEEAQRRKRGKETYISKIKDLIKMRVTEDIYNFYHDKFWRDKEWCEESKGIIKKLTNMKLKALESMNTRMTASLRTCFMHENTRSIPLDIFFAPYTQGTLAKDYRILDSRDDYKLLVLRNKYGIFWFCIFDPCKPSGQVDLIDEVYGDGITRAAAQFSNPGGGTGENIVSIARIDPYICNNCHIYKPFMKKCGECSRKLGIDVRYCSKRCQGEDYDIRHKHVCGKCLE